MNTPTVRTASMLIVLVVAGLAAGCARKVQEAPPTPPAPPVRQPAPTPEPPKPPEPAPTPRVTSSDFQAAFFDFDSYAIRSDARGALDRNAKLLRDNADTRITIEGHCDERGTVEYNLALGEKRAQAARDYLVAAGVSSARIDIVSYGKERPFMPGHDESAWAQNRRAHFVVR